MVRKIGMLLADVHDSLRPRVIEKVAFMVGSSKQGKDLLASVASNCVTAKYLKHNNKQFLSKEI